MESRPTQIVRKTAYGRTELFLPSQTAIVREVKCMKGVLRYDTASVYHMLPPSHEEDDVVCWHCCEAIPKGQTIPLPKVYDTAEKVFHVYGATCSPSCAKAYIVEHTTYERGKHMNVLTKMLKEVYGITSPVPIAPPRCSFRRFGGPFQPSRKTNCDFSLLHPPFVSYCMLVEERGANGEVSQATLPAENMVLEEADTFDEPPPPGLYAGFLGKMANAGTSSEREKTTRKQTKRSLPASKTPPSGPMSKFMRPSSP